MVPMERVLLLGRATNSSTGCDAHSSTRPVVFSTVSRYRLHSTSQHSPDMLGGRKSSMISLWYRVIPLRSSGKVCFFGFSGARGARRAVNALVSDGCSPTFLDEFLSADFVAFLDPLLKTFA